MKDVPIRKPFEKMGIISVDESFKRLERLSITPLCLPGMFPYYPSSSNTNNASIERCHISNLTLTDYPSYQEWVALSYNL